MGVIGRDGEAGCLAIITTVVDGIADPIDRVDAIAAAADGGATGVDGQRAGAIFGLDAMDAALGRRARRLGDQHRCVAGVIEAAGKEATGGNPRAIGARHRPARADAQRAVASNNKRKNPIVPAARCRSGRADAHAAEAAEANNSRAFGARHRPGRGNAHVVGVGINPCGPADRRRRNCRTAAVVRNRGNPGVVPSKPIIGVVESRSRSRHRPGRGNAQAAAAIAGINPDGLACNSGIEIVRENQPAGADQR